MTTWMTRARSPLSALLLLAALASVAGCSAPTALDAPTTGGTASALTARIDEIDQAVRAWRTAPNVRTAHARAEEARNLVVGEHGPYFGDGDGNGTVEGASERGLLPGLRGEPGIAVAADGACVIRDVLGGDWDDPAVRWAVLDTAINAWTQANNPFPSLHSHPQRIVGWATLTLATEQLAEATEFGGHAQLHVDVSRRAVADCR